MKKKIGVKNLHDTIILPPTELLITFDIRVVILRTLLKFISRINK